MSTFSSLSKHLSAIRSNRVSTSPQRSRFATPGDLNTIFNDSDSKTPPSRPKSPGQLGISSPGVNANTTPDGDIKSPPLFENNKSPTNGSYPNVPSLYELMPDNSRVFYIPEKLQDVPIHLLRFPFNFIKNGSHPFISHAPPIETFSYFAIVESKDNHVILEKFDEFHTIIHDFQDDVISWFPFCHQEQANWYVEGGYLQMNSFIPSDLSYYVTHRRPSDPSLPSSVPDSTSTETDSNLSISTSTASFPEPIPPPVPPPVQTPPMQPFPGHFTYPHYNHFIGSNPYQQAFVSSPPTMPFHPSPAHYGHGYHPNSNWIPQNTPGFQSVLFKATEIDCPKWDGNTSTWHNMHTK